jgi:Fe-Mn family superoxide dismutase
MTDLSLNRRTLIAAGAALTAGSLLAGSSVAAAQAPSPASKGFTPVPLPFDPKSITGFSEKILISHHDNNYVGAVKRLGAIQSQFAALDPATAPGFQINGLKREELIAWNSMILHEIYFSEFGAANKPGAKLAQAIERDFGSQAKWAAEFIAMGKALGGGSGWVILTYSHRDNRLVNQWANDHTMTMAGASPILVMDMYEHAYAMDFGAKAAAYVDAFMATVNWATADARFARSVA